MAPGVGDVVFSSVTTGALWLASFSHRRVWSGARPKKRFATDEDVRGRNVSFSQSWKESFFFFRQDVLQVQDRAKDSGLPQLRFLSNVAFISFLLLK